MNRWTSYNHRTRRQSSYVVLPSTFQHYGSFYLRMGAVGTFKEHNIIYNFVIIHTLYLKILRYRYCTHIEYLSCIYIDFADKKTQNKRSNTYVNVIFYMILNYSIIFLSRNLCIQLKKSLSITFLFSIFRNFDLWRITIFYVTNYVYSVWTSH